MGKFINLAGIDFAGGGGSPTPPTPPGPTPTPSAGYNDVVLIDYDGNILHSYSKSEFLALSSLPTPPEHENLTAIGYNWTLAEAKAYVTKYGRHILGAQYKSSDGATRIKVLMLGDLTPSMTLGINGSISIDWGDETTPTEKTGTNIDNDYTIAHTYSEPGEYTIIVKVLSGKVRFKGNSYNDSFLLFESTYTYKTLYKANITEIILGDNVVLDSYAFAGCYSLKKIMIPEDITLKTGVSNLFRKGSGLSGIVIPRNFGMGSNNIQFFYGNNALQVVSLGYGISYFTFLVNNNNQALSQFIIPDGVTAIGDRNFQYYYSLSTLIIPDSVTTIGNNAFDNTSIGTLWVYATTPPAAGTNMFSGSPIKAIYVPAASVDAYKAASGWSTYANKIQAIPE